MDNEQKESEPGYSLAKSERVPLQDVVSEDKAQSEAAAGSLTFRGKPIAWVEVPKTETKILENAIGEDYIEERQSGVRHLIAYENKHFIREDFLKSAFPDYKKHPYKVKFKTDDIFRLGGN